MAQLKPVLMLKPEGVIGDFHGENAVAQLKRKLWRKAGYEDGEFPRRECRGPIEAAKAAM